MTTIATRHDLAFTPAAIEATRLVQAEAKRHAALAEHDRAAAMLLTAKTTSEKDDDE